MSFDSLRISTRLILLKQLLIDVIEEYKGTCNREILWLFAYHRKCGFIRGLNKHLRLVFQFEKICILSTKSMLSFSISPNFAAF